MPIRTVRTAHFIFPARQWLHMAGLVLMVASGVTLLGMSRSGNPAVERLRTNITDILVPVLSVAASPIDAIHDAASWARDIGRLRSENIELKNERAELLQWQQAAKDMEEENHALRNLLGVVPAKKTSYVTARIVADSAGPYVRSALLAGGRDNGIHKDRAVIAGDGLIGRVIEAGVRSSRILLLTDINSRVPVLAEHAHEKAILSGRNTGLPSLSYVAADSKIAVGERIVTSGDGGVFPRGIPVGVVTSIDHGLMTVQPFADPAAADYVSVVDSAL